MEPQNTQNTQTESRDGGVNVLTGRIIGCALTVLHGLGPGFLEKVYERALVHELRKAGLAVSRQHLMTVWYDGVVVGEYTVDLLVEDSVFSCERTGRPNLGKRCTQLNSPCSTSCCAARRGSARPVRDTPPRCGRISCALHRSSHGSAWRARRPKARCGRSLCRA